MADAATLLRSFVAYFDGLDDMIPASGTPSKVQWAKIRKRVEAMREAVLSLPASNGSNGHYAPAAPVGILPGASAEDPVPGGATVNRKWFEAVSAALQTDPWNCDPESARDIMKGLQPSLNEDPVAVAARLAGPT